MVLGEREVRYDALIRAAVGVSQRLAELGRGARGRRHPARPPLHRGGRRDARLPAPRRRPRAAAADVQRDAAGGARRADRAPRRSWPSAVTRRSPSAAPSQTGCRCCSSCALRTWTPQRPRTGRRTATPRDADAVAIVLHSSGTTSAPKGVAHSSNTLRYAAEGVCRRWGLTGEDIYLTVVEFGFVGGLVFGYLPVLLNGATGVLLDRWNAEDALGADRAAPVHVRARDADARGRHDPRRGADRARPLLHAHPRRAGPDARTARRHAQRLRHPAAGRLWPFRGTRPRRPRAGRPGGEDPGHGGTAVRGDGDPDPRPRRAAAPSGRGGLGRRQRSQPLPRLLQQRRAHRASP